MTAKRKAGGKLARLEALEAKRAARVEEVKAANWADIERAGARLSPADRAALQSVGLLGGGRDELEDLTRQAAGMGEDGGPRVEVMHPAKAEAEAWEAVALEVPEGARLLAPPAGRVADFVAYFEAVAAEYDALARRVPLAPVLHRLAGICAALERFTARLCEVLAEDRRAA